MAENISPGAPIADQEEVKVQSGRARALAAADLPDKVHTWPYLVRAEFISGCVLLLVLLVWSITVDAPMEEPANPTKTPNPSKAPWYFLGLQEMLVYFDPWIAGVVLPSLIIVGLMVIPYVDINPKGNGYYTWSERKFAISTFVFGFLVLWVGMITIGVFFRGPGWNLFMPWDYWDPHKVVPLTNIDLPYFLGIRSEMVAVLFGLCTGWAVYDEVFPRRPWKGYQRDFFQLEEKHLKADLARAEKRLEQADAKAKREAVRKDLQEATAAISGNPEQRRTYDAAVKADDETRIKEAEAKLYLGFDKSRQDNVYYELREARHDEDAKREAKLQKEYDEWQRKIDEKQRIYEAAIAHHQQTTKAREAFQARKDKAQPALDAMEKPSLDLKKKIETVSGKWPQMEQYWVQDLKNSWGGPTVDRCQNCHVAVNKGGFSAPWEVLEARKNKMPDADMKAQFALDPEVIDAYQTVHDKLCEDLPPVPSAIPPGGWQPPAPPQPMDPASATECRPRAAWQRWLERGQAYCRPGGRWLARTKTVLKDAKGGVVALAQPERKATSRNPAEDALREGEKARPEDRVAQACTDKETLTACEQADKAD